MRTTVIPPIARTRPHSRTAIPIVIATIALIAVTVVGAFVLTGEPSSSARAKLFGGSVVLPYQGHDPVVADMATGRASLRLRNLAATVGAKSADDLILVPTASGTVVVNRVDGTYNMLDRDNLLVAAGGGISLPPGGAGPVAIRGHAAGEGAFVVRQSRGRTEVWLIDRATVASGVGGHAVTPVAAADLAETASTVPAAAASTGSDLWLVSRVEGDRAELTRLQPPHEPGANKLIVERFGTVPASSVLAAGSGVVAAVAPRTPVVRVVSNGSAHDVAIRGFDAVTSVVAGTEGAGRAWLAARDDAGWHLVGLSAGTAAAPGEGEGQGEGEDAGTAPLTIDLASMGRPTTVGTPVSLGRWVFVVAADDGSIWRADTTTGEASRVVGQERYPTLADEHLTAGVLADVTGQVRDSRAVLNSPSSLRALLMDDRGEPVGVIDKSTAQNLDPNAPPSPDIKDVSATTPGRAPSEAPASSTPTVPDTVQDRVSETDTCANLTQIPRRPQVRSLDPTKNTMTVTWSYTKLDPSDCQPSSYLVEARGANGADDPPDPVRPHSNAQTQFTFTGLRPNRTYEFIVTAVIGANRVASDPMRRATDITGPDAARSVKVSAGEPGGWTVEWDACHGNECDVAASTWEVSWAQCGDAGGFVGAQKAEVGLSGDRRSTRIALDDHPDLVGVSLRFTVTAVSVAGDRSSTGDDACDEGWQAPDIAALKILPEARAEEDGTISLTVTLTEPGNPRAVFGTAHPSFAYVVDTARRVGPTPELRTEFGGLEAGVDHTLIVEVTSHNATRRTPPIMIDPTLLAWPVLVAKASLAIDGNPNLALATITVTGDVPDNVIGSARFTCAALVARSPDVALRGATMSWSVNLITGIGPECDVAVTLNQGGPRRRFKGSLDLDAGHVSTAGVTPPTMTTRWAPDGLALLVSGSTPVAGDAWQFRPIGGARPGCTPAGLTVGAGVELKDYRVAAACIDGDGQIDLAWRYLATVSTTTITAPTPTPPTTLPPPTTAPPVTTAKPPTTPKPTTTTAKPPAPPPAAASSSGLLLPAGAWAALVARRRRDRARRRNRERNRSTA